MKEEKRTVLLEVLKERFELNKSRHPDLVWTEIEDRLLRLPEKLISLSKMEETGGEPDVIGRTSLGEVIFCDCSKESPAGRRSICYDRKALNARKQNKPQNDTMSLAKEMGVDILDQDQYKNLQSLGEFDQKTSSWLKTPEEIRDLGGAIFGDRRYNQVFIYHNGAESYYAARGFRGILNV